ncbi:MAG: SulP family inorganic anion transporter [Patescibacteria group bacterium]
MTPLEAAQKVAKYAVATLTPWRQSLHGYSSDSFRFDVVAGLTVAGIIIPQAMAQALLVGIPPVYGLYALLVASFFGALWGSSRFVVTAPVAVVSLLTLTALLPHAEPGSPEYIALAVVLAFLVGLIQLLAGFFHLGFLSRLIPHPVLTGFSVAAGITIAFLQLPNLLGFSIKQQPFVIETLWGLVLAIPKTHWLTAFIGVTALIVIVVVRRIFPRSPIALFVLAGSILLGLVVPLGEYGVPLVGAVPAGIPVFFLPSLSLSAVISILGSAFVIALVGFMETYAIGSALAKRHDEHVAANQELVGQGMANIAASFVGGYPVSGSFSASAVNEVSGGKTAVTGVVLSIATLLTLLFFTWFLAYLPKAILAAVVIASVVQLVRIRDIGRALRISRIDGLLACATLGIALVIKPDSAIIGGMALALVLFIHRIMWPRVEEMGFAPGEPLMRPLTEEGVKRLEAVVCVRPHLSVLYANAEYVVEQLDLLTHSRNFKILALHFGSINHIDLTGLEELGQYFSNLRKRGVRICAIGMKPKEQALIERAAEIVGPIERYETVPQFLERGVQAM